MKHLISLVVALAALAAGAASAQTLRWATQGDAQTMDPHSQNEQLTNSMNTQVYEYLIGRDKELNLVPGLALEWQQTGPLQWRFKLRPKVKFHDGTPFTADDVVFSINRAKEKTSQIATYANQCGEPKKIDDLTVEFTLPQVNPIFLQHLNYLFIMSRSWSEKNKTTVPLDYKNKEESYASFNANGTGPYMLVSRQPGIKTTYKRNPNWWGKFEGNVQEVVYTQISNDATRLAALVSGEVDFVLDPAPRDVARLRNTPGVKVVDGRENRILFIGMDQGRDELLYGSVKGKNPLKDVRVRRALYQAVDIETIKTKLMNNQAFPTGAVMPSPLGTFNDPELEKRLPYDVAAAKKLMADAGYPSGFEVTFDCPNNRYINDEEICVALAGMWSQLGVKVRVNAMPRATFFAKLDKLDTSMYLLGWGGSVTDAETTLTPVYRNRGTGGVGYYNYGNYKDDALDEAAAASTREPDVKKREQLIKTALKLHNEAVHHIPLHRQVIPWAARANIDVVHRADNFFTVEWVTINKLQ
jgi:peptide/nickel transport system substrate-binding protein